VQQLKLVFTKEDFDIFLYHHRYNHIIELILGIELKLSKIYLLSFKKQSELDIFIIKNLLQLMPQECIMEMDIGHDDMIGCAKVVSVSASYSRCFCLASSLLLLHVI